MISLEFEFERQTPGTVRYKEVPEEGVPVVVGTLYIKKGALKGLEKGKDFPQSLTVTVEAG